jgi:hypothetical protein
MAEWFNGEYEITTRKLKQKLEDIERGVGVLTFSAAKNPQSLDAISQFVSHE